MRLRIVRVRNFYYVERKFLGYWLKADHKFRALSLRRARSYVSPKVIRQAYHFQVKQPKEIIEYLK